ncbi:aldehyde reductase [Mycena metata]|uniref:Aldehyde reductase n=1 Tax=Mycena metata TaxID=1033252 RepID=A0AAD7IZH6_9AGAR|nr:aldehyde reductase [Mycena metata]
MANTFPKISIEKVYKLLKEGGVDTIDTGRIYGVSEEWIGKTGGGKRFTIDSKTPGGLIPGSSTGETIPQHAKETVERLGVDKVDVYYIHDQLRGINTAYTAGHFKRFGLSNFTPADVQRIYDICKENGYPLPTVYQGNYSAVARKPEAELIPLLLRKLGIALYIYSPISGGLLTKTSTQLREREGGAMEPLYDGLYHKPSYHTALDLWAEAAAEAGCSKADLAYRWVASDSALDAKYGDAIVFANFGNDCVAQTWVKIDEIWKVVEHDAPLDNFNK